MHQSKRSAALLQECQLAGPFPAYLPRVGVTDGIHLGELVLPVIRPDGINDDAAARDVSTGPLLGREHRIDVAGPAAINDVGLRFRIPTGDRKSTRLNSSH